MTIDEVKNKISGDSENWRIYLMDFVDEFRSSKDRRMIENSFTLNHERFDALLASVTHYLCDELKIPVPDWVYHVPACRAPWFVAELETLKAITIVESPAHFRLRKIFVLSNFLSRV